MIKKRLFASLLSLSIFSLLTVTCYATGDKDKPGPIEGWGDVKRTAPYKVKQVHAGPGPSPLCYSLDVGQDSFSRVSQRTECEGVRRIGELLYDCKTRCTTIGPGLGLAHWCVSECERNLPKTLLDMIVG